MFNSVMKKENNNQKLTLKEVTTLVEESLKNWIDDVATDYLKVQSNEIDLLDVKASSLRIPFELIGRAGLGKTDLINEVYQRCKLYAENKHGINLVLKSTFSSIGNTTKFSGMEIPETNGDELISKRAYPHYAPESNELTLFYADEARDYGQRGLQELQKLTDTSNPTFGDRYVPFTFVVLSSNGSEDNIFANVFNPPFQNRIVSLRIKPELTHWVEWALQNYLDKRVIAFAVAIKLDEFDELTEAEQVELNQFITFRSLTTLSKKLKLFESDEKLLRACGSWNNWFINGY